MKVAPKIDYYHVVSKSLRVRIPCDGPLMAQIKRTELEESTKAADVEIEYPKKLRLRARPGAGRKPNTKQRYK